MDKDLHIGISANVSAKVAMNRIEQVGRWWTRELTGKSEKVGNAFTAHFGDRFVSFRVVESIPDKKVVWRVTDCHRWISNKQDWIDTDVIFEIAEESGTTTVNFTHKGLVPGLECYDECMKGWTHYVARSLRRLLTEGQGLPYQG